MTQQWQFKVNTPLHKRLEMMNRLRATYPDRVPIIIETDTKSQLQLHRVRFLAPKDSTLQRLFTEIRKQVQDGNTTLREDTALFVLFGEAQIMAPLSRSVGELYTQCRDPEDGLLYGRLVRESTFG